ncbi:hypothetical protein GCM10022223_63100 [Kineosporia mesophila]|uniref:Pheromone n=1 Tax=Kineosporia mesophila TaxID=566012 RepID=A0ABP7AMW5_9ACTN
MLSPSLTHRAEEVFGMATPMVPDEMTADAASVSLPHPASNMAPAETSDTQTMPVRDKAVPSTRPPPTPGRGSTITFVTIGCHLEG